MQLRFVGHICSSAGEVRAPPSEYGCDGDAVMGEATNTVAEDDAEDLFSNDPFRLTKGTGTERFRKVIDTVRTQQLDVVGQARNAMSARGIDLDRHLADFAEACRLPGVHVELEEAPEISDLHGPRGYLVVGPALRFSSHALGQR